MKIKNFTTFAVIYSVLIFTFALTSVENSIIPTIERFENIENLPVAKLTKNQFGEIQSTLSRKDERIRLASYNILFNIHDGNLEEVNRWPQRLPRIVELLDEMQPDILGVQELYAAQLENLQPFTEGTYAFFSRPCKDGEMNGIFYRKDRFEVVDSNVWFMTATPDVPSSSTLTMVQLKDLKTGRVVAVFNAHLAFGKAEKREFQARFIAEHIESIAAQMPVIFMGDLNTFSNRLDLPNLPFYDGDYIHRILTQGALRDAKDTSILGHLGPIGTFTNEIGDSKPFKGTGEPGIFLDHIYISKGITVLIHAVQPGTVNGHFPSDHMPILIDFMLE